MKRCAAQTTWFVNRRHSEHRDDDDDELVSMLGLVFALVAVSNTAPLEEQESTTVDRPVYEQSLSRPGC